MALAVTAVTEVLPASAVHLAVLAARVALASQVILAPRVAQLVSPVEMVVMAALVETSLLTSVVLPLAMAALAALVALVATLLQLPQVHQAVMPALAAMAVQRVARALPVELAVL